MLQGCLEAMPLQHCTDIRGSACRVAMCWKFLSSRKKSSRCASIRSAYLEIGHVLEMEMADCLESTSRRWPNPNACRRAGV